MRPAPEADGGGQRPGYAPGAARVPAGTATPAGPPRRPSRSAPPRSAPPRSARLKRIFPSTCNL